jgi:membrane protein
VRRKRVLLSKSAAPTIAEARRGASAVAKVFTEHDLLTYSSAIAFQVLYAAVPVGLLALAGLGVVGAESLYTHHIANTLRHHLSREAFDIVNRTAIKAMTAKRLWWATVGLGVTLWGIGAAVRSMMGALNAIYGAREQRSWRRRLVVSIGAGALAAALVFCGILVALVGRLIHAGGALGSVLFAARWLGALLFLIAANAVLIRFVPSKERPLPWVTVGSTLSAICWAVATTGFAAYVSAVPYASFYGALATIVLLLMYFHVAAIAFLLGVVVDSLLRERVSRDRGRRGRARRRAGT